MTSVKQHEIKVHSFMSNALNYVRYKQPQIMGITTSFFKITLFKSNHSCFMNSVDGLGSYHNL